ncbi:hypothetical protein [Flagellimonas sp. 2504JD1-5]
MISVNSFGQGFKAEVIFKNGKVLKGLGEPAHQHWIRFKKEKKAKKEFFSFREVDTVKVWYDFTPTVFVYQKIKDRTYPDVLEVVHVGEKVIYYRDDTQGYMTSKARGGLHGVPLTHSFVRKKREEEAIHLGTSYWVSKNFKKAASNFFSDCPALVEKIQNKELKKKNLMAIIDFYNNSCE